MPIEVTGRDLAQWVSGGVIRHDPSGKLVRVIEVHDDTIMGETIGEDRERLTFPPEHATLWWPHVRALNVHLFKKSFGVYVYRTAVRQWRRTYFANHIEINVCRHIDVEFELNPPEGSLYLTGEADAIILGLDTDVLNYYPSGAKAMRMMEEILQWPA